MVSEVANKSLENKFMKKDEMEDIKSNEFNSKERVEPSFMSLENNEENKLNTIDNIIQLCRILITIIFHLF